MVEWVANWGLPFLLPPGATLVGGLAAGVLAWRGFRKTALAAVVVSLGALWLAATPWVAEGIAASLETRYAPVPVAEAPPADAVLVLGGGVGPAWSPRLTPDLGAAADRLWWAVLLHRAGRAPLIVVTGGGTGEPGDPMTEGRASRRLLLEWGVASEQILVEDRSQSTRENCRYAAGLLPPGSRVLLVTSAMHMPRALDRCREAGLDAIASPTDFRVVAAARTALRRRWLPDAASLQMTSQALKEFLATWAGALLTIE